MSLEYNRYGEIPSSLVVIGPGVSGVGVASIGVEGWPWAGRLDGTAAVAVVVGLDVRGGVEPIGVVVGKRVVFDGGPGDGLGVVSVSAV